MPEAHALPPELIPVTSPSFDTTIAPYLAKNQQAVDEELFHDVIHAHRGRVDLDRIRRFDERRRGPRGVASVAAFAQQNAPQKKPMARIKARMAILRFIAPSPAPHARTHPRGSARP